CGMPFKIKLYHFLFQFIFIRFSSHDLTPQDVVCPLGALSYTVYCKVIMQTLARTGMGLARVDRTLARTGLALARVDPTLARLQASFAQNAMSSARSSHKR
ncbi:hypothetical protein ORD22_14760, partial [Sporosarcina sp. GW1-11]|uniref:hypothetical protein n=1 Tax=Sporosarcina sp. GW1-11 TaxID=2899126 RepID=UPI00294BBCF1